jgi:hypothetical protein
MASLRAVACCTAHLSNNLVRVTHDKHLQVTDVRRKSGASDMARPPSYSLISEPLYSWAMLCSALGRRTTTMGLLAHPRVLAPGMTHPPSEGPVRGRQCSAKAFATCPMLISKNIVRSPSSRMTGKRLKRAAPLAAQARRSGGQSRSLGFSVREYAS